MSKTKWYQKPTYLLVALALVLSLGVVAVPVGSVVGAAPSEVWVDDDYCDGCYNDGHTWGYDAFARIQDGIDKVKLDLPATVYVAAGNYSVETEIILFPKLQLLGAGADVTTMHGSGSNTQVVRTYDGGPETKLDGFTITNGKRGIKLTNCSPVISNCRFVDNNSVGSYQNGGGMWNINSSPAVTNCTFSGNSVDWSGGGMYNYDNSSPAVTNCVFSGNSAGSGPSVGYGGGMYNYDNSSPTVTNCVFSDNSGNRYGGGMGNRNGSSPEVTNCILSGNSASYYGGGMYNNNSSPTVTNCIFDGNSAGRYGGGMYSGSGSSPNVKNCIFVNSSAGWAGGGGGLYADASHPIDYNDVWNNTPNNYGGSCSPGPHDIDQDPMFVNPAAHDYHSKPGSPCIDAGTNVGAPTEDIEENPRPVDGDGDGWAITDMGAYEYVPPPPPPPNVKYLHSTDGLFNLTDPIGTQWHELWPVFCRGYHLSSWNDTGGDGVLSRCDQIDMYQKPDGEVRWYHVENVTITLNVTPETMGEPMYIELEGGYNASVLINPVGTQWHEIYPNMYNCYHLSAWATDNGGKLGYCDYIDLTDKATGEVTIWHVEEVAIDIIVTIEPPPVGGQAYPVNKISLLAPWIAMAALLAGGAGWLALRRRRTQS